MIFLDNASTTQISEEINQLVFETNREQFFNPSALYINSQKVAELIKENIKSVQTSLYAQNFNVVFTSGATESNNMAIRGFLNNNKSAEYLFSMGEHPSVYNVAEDLRQKGFNVKYVKLDKSGVVDFEDFKQKVNQNTAFISITHVSNETGAVNNIQELAKYAKSVNNKVIFHSDGVQAVGKVEVNLQKLNVDLYTISGHKINAPRGIGILMVNKNLSIKPLILGGGQQTNLRSGTENTSGILAITKAIEIATQNQKANAQKVQILRDYIKQNLINQIPNCKINEAAVNSPYILSVSFSNFRGEVLLHLLAEKQIIIGTGSACSSKKADNRTLSNMGNSKEQIQGSIRVGICAENTMEEIILVTQTIIDIVKNGYNTKE